MSERRAAAYSSSPASEPTVADLVERAFAIVRSESPPHASGFADALGSTAIEVEIDGERLLVRSATVERGAGGGDIVASTSGRALLDLLDGRIALVDAVRERRVLMRAGVKDLARGARAMRWLLHGLVRSHGGAELVEELRRLVRRRGRDGGVEGYGPVRSEVAGQA